MQFIQTEFNGLFIIKLERVEDNRGFFARSFCVDEFSKHGLNPNIYQCNISFNNKKGTLRGMHYQKAPFEEDKLVRVTKGSIFDAVVDIRPNSKTYKKSFTINLSSENGTMLFVPKGFAHGFQTLEDNTEIFYQMSERFDNKSASGLRYDDPVFSIDWPIPISEISEKDAAYPDFKEEK